MAMVTAMDVIQKEIVVVIEIQVNEDSVSINTTAKLTIFLSVVGKSLENQHGHRW